MASYTLSTTVNRPWDETIEAVRTALQEQGFGILTEIDLQATLKSKLDVAIDKHVILGACQPELAHKAIAAEPSIAAVLPCNVVVRFIDETTTSVEAFDPDVMMGFADSDALHTVAGDAKHRLAAALASITGHEVTPQHE